MIDLRCGDALTLLREMPEASVDAIVTDPPYGLKFMGKAWDHGIPGVPYWEAALRVAKPGAHLLAFGGTRTFHRLACAIEDAGWEIRDCVMWVYGSGFPKSHDVSKAMDRAAGVEREVVGPRANVHSRGEHKLHEGWKRPWQDDLKAVERSMSETAPATDAAKKWQGWGTALKPAWEPVIMARKPLVGTVADNVQRYGTGAINVDGCRIDANGRPAIESKSEPSCAVFGDGLNGPAAVGLTNLGRWPANVVHDGSEEVLAGFPESGNGAGAPTISKRPRNKGWVNASPGDGVQAIDNFGDSGSAARFFYCAKASRSERNAGLENWIEERFAPTMNNGIGGKEHDPETATLKHNHHPTVKPVALMQWLCRLVTPPAGVILDPFMGSGSTGIAADREGFAFVGFDLNPEYVELARRRIAADCPLFVEEHHA